MRAKSFDVLDIVGWVMKEHGQPESRLTVIGFDHDEVKETKKGKNYYYYYLCKCECGNEKIIERRGVLGDRTKSCGCLNKEKIANVGYKNKKFNKYDLSGKFGIGWTSNTNEPFYFDLEDYDKIKNYCWSEHRPSSNSKDYKSLTAPNYPNGNIKFWWLIKGKYVDHINNNTFDNRKENLREATLFQNSYNLKTKKNNSSGFSGVSWSTAVNKWRARVMLNRKEIHLGVFDSFEEAKIARLKGEAKYFGEFSPHRDLFEEYGISIEEEQNK